MTSQRPPLPPPTQWTAPLLLTIRFSTSIPDLELDIPSPNQTTVASLKHLIRTRLQEPNSQRRLRFIHQGKILPDQAALSAVLRPPPPPTPSPNAAPDPKGKGKAVEGKNEPQARIYVNCSIGDSLTDEELGTEAKAALLAPSAAAGVGTGQTAGGRGILFAEGHAPRGFERLLGAGFTAAEVNQLRLQFREIQANMHTPDTMPDDDEMRSMEDSWIDTNAGGALPGGGGNVADMGDEASNVQDVLIQGVLMGFFWPIGCLAWLLRDDAIFSPRWQLVIMFGVTLGILIGVVKAISGDN